MDRAYCGCCGMKHGNLCPVKENWRGNRTTRAPHCTNTFATILGAWGSVHDISCRFDGAPGTQRSTRFAQSCHSVRKLYFMNAALCGATVFSIGRASPHTACEICLIEARVGVRVKGWDKSRRSGSRAVIWPLCIDSDPSFVPHWGWKHWANDFLVNLSWFEII